MDTDTIIKQLKLKEGNTYIKHSGKINNLQQIDNEKIKYRTGRSSKYIKLSLLLNCYKTLSKEKTLLVKWIKNQDKIQPCDSQFILAIFVEAGLGKYYIPNGKTRPLGINYTI